ncbi:[protein-PII] uridylyltransferase [Thermodesulfobacteriota bacterium]
MQITAPIDALKESRDLLITNLGDGKDFNRFQEDHAEFFDEYFRRCLEESEVGRSLFRRKNPFAIVAVGGYGRRELSLHSDIDVIILFKSRIPSEAKELNEDFFFPLWDLGFEIGYAVRSIRDCLKLSKGDFEVMTSLMDARFVCGASSVYLTLMDNLQQKVISSRANAFCKWLTEKDRLRKDIFGDASQLLEPNLKEGIGGLRDYHYILWLAGGLFNLRSPKDLEYTGKFSHGEYSDLRKSLQFIWRVRNHLHHLSARRNDRLNFEYQEKIALLLNFKDNGSILGVEEFLARLHVSMATIKSLNQSFMNHHLPSKRKPGKLNKSVEVSKRIVQSQGELNFDLSTSIVSNPYLLMEIFEYCAGLSIPLSMESKRLVTEFLYLIDDDFRCSQQAVKGFLKIINSSHAALGLDQMLGTGFLEAFIPEFGAVKDLVQFDDYHIYPVGRHMLETFNNLKNLACKSEIILLDIFTDLTDREPLLLAGLFHDIGKFGHDHAERGAVIMRTILQRFGYNEKSTEVVLFLLRYHLLLVETATRRDLNDEKAVVQCAGKIGDIERLNMLYLLTWADSKATGPKAWNEWIGNLVQELFFKILHILERGELAGPNASERISSTKAEISAKMKGRIEEKLLKEMSDAMSPRYLFNTPSTVIVKHIEMHRLLDEKIEKEPSAAFLLESKKDGVVGSRELTFLAKDRPGLFADISGVLALNNINILSAEIYTWRNGTVVDIFRVTEPLDEILVEQTWQKVRGNLLATFQGKLSLPYRLNEKKASSQLLKRNEPSFPPRVSVDNQSSDFFTLIEVFARDRIGLLYLITHSLFNLRLDIRIAKIATKGSQVTDVFYVRDLDGQKIEDQTQIDEICQALMYELEQG